MRQLVFFLFLLAGFFFIQTTYGQHTDSLNLEGSKKDSLLKDTLLIKNDRLLPISKTLIPHTKDSVIKKKHDPRKATIYSAILPGAGQVYNGKYWKVPIVYAAVGIPAYAFFFNKSWYKKLQYALAVTINQSQGDSLAKVDPLLRPFVNNGDVNAIITGRDSYRKNQDYSVLFFLLFYGLNIVDATVDAHLRDFNVNSDLSLKIKPILITGPSLMAGVSLVFDIHKGKPRPLNMN